MYWFATKADIFHGIVYKCLQVECFPKQYYLSKIQTVNVQHYTHAKPNLEDNCNL